MREHAKNLSRLELIQTEDITWIWGQSHTSSLGCILTTRELVNGQMQVTKVQQFPTTDP